MLEVRISEMDRRVSKRLGINFAVVNSAGEFGVSLLGGLSGFLIDGSAHQPLTLPPGLLRLISPWRKRRRIPVSSIFLKKTDW